MASMSVDAEKVLRRMLWRRHGCPSSSMYGDDGEMQCNAPGCMIDFKRMSADEIESAFRAKGERILDRAIADGTIKL